MATALATPKASPAPDIRLTRPALTTHLVLVSPKQARDIEAETFYPGQRPVRPYQVAFLKLLIEAGHLRPGTMITFVRVGKAKSSPLYCINGHHTLLALGEGSRAYWLQYEEYTVADEAEVSRLYQTYDRNLARSWKDLEGADMTLQALGLARNQLSQLGAVTQILASGFRQSAAFGSLGWNLHLKDPYRRFAMMQDWSEEMAAWSTGIAGEGRPRGQIAKLLRRASVLAVALVTYRYAPEQAHHFWPRVAADSGLEQGEPAHALLQYLRENPTRPVVPATYQRSVAACWNAYIEGRKIGAKIQPGAAAKPIRIAGTPHDGRRTLVYLTKTGEIAHVPQDADADEAETANS
jgi:hypothetical protein